MSIETFPIPNTDHKESLEELVADAEREEQQLAAITSRIAELDIIIAQPEPSRLRSMLGLGKNFDKEREERAELEEQRQSKEKINQTRQQVIAKLKAELGQ